MKRRTFIKHSLSAILATGAAPYARGAAASPDSSPRLAMTTVSFLNRFHQTRSKADAENSPTLTLFEVPEYFSDRFKLGNLEFWNRHFESTAEPYLKGLKKAIARQGCKLVNIQLDGSYDLSSPDEEKRQESLRLVQEWIDVARTVGSAGLRANPGAQSIERSVESFRTLADYARGKGVRLYAENHMGFGTNPENMLRLYREAEHDNLFLLTDFGNFDKSVDRLEGIRRMIPHTGLVSAKVFHIDEQGRHPDFDFEACVRACEESGYRGIYSAEYYDSRKRGADPEQVADWQLKRLRELIA